ncbi:MAG: hypothetical protein ACOCYE_13815 [Pseudomonadota bacterium]
MDTMIGTGLVLPTLVGDFLRLEGDGRAVCQVGAELVGNPDGRDLLEETLATHERHLAWLRRVGEECGTVLPDGGTDYAASRVGGIRLAHRVHEHGGDRAVLAAVAVLEVDTVQAYHRVLRGTALSAVLRPAFERARGDLARQSARLDQAARTAA